MFPACCFRQRTRVAQGLFNGNKMSSSLIEYLIKRPCASTIYP